MTYIKINNSKNNTATIQFMLKLLLLALLVILAVGINIYLYKMSHQPVGSLSGLLPANAQELITNYL